MRKGSGGWRTPSRETEKWLKIWLDDAKISEGPIFRRLIGRDQIGDARHPGSIAPIFNRVAQWIGMPARSIAEVSGHSTRAGAAQDLTELDIDLAAITQAGGWKSTRMPLQYPERINAARSGMARAAAEQGRDPQCRRPIFSPSLPWGKLWHTERQTLDKCPMAGFTLSIERVNHCIGSNDLIGATCLIA
jgi:hypothetical protein